MTSTCTPKPISGTTFRRFIHGCSHYSFQGYECRKCGFRFVFYRATCSNMATLDDALAICTPDYCPGCGFRREGNP